MLTHYNIFANVIQTGCWGHSELRRGEDSYLLVIPYFHIYGFTVGMMEGVWRGAQQILIPKYDVEMLLNAIRDYQPTFFPAVPTIYISLLNHPREKEYGLDRIRNFNSGSAPLPVEVIEQFDDWFGSRSRVRPTGASVVVVVLSSGYRDACDLLTAPASRA